MSATIKQWLLGLRDGETPLAHPRLSARYASVLIGLVVLGGLVVPGGRLGIDMRWSELMRDAEASWWTHLALAFNALGHGILRGLTIAGVGLVLLIAGRRAALLAFALAEALTPLLVNLIKLLVGRERPPGAMIEAHGSSYPSGHAAYAGATAVLLVLLFTSPGRQTTSRMGRGRRLDCRDGLESNLFTGALAVGRCCGSHARRRRRLAHRRGRPDRLDAAGPCERLRRDRAAIQVTAAWLLVSRRVAQAVGRCTVKRPPVVSVWAVISPPALRASRRASASPRPAPRWSAAPALPRMPGSKILVASSIAMPGTVVGNGDCDVGSCRDEADGYLGAAVSECVVKQRMHDSLDEIRFDGDAGFVRWERHTDDDPAARCLVANAFDCKLDSGPSVGRGTARAGFVAGGCDESLDRSTHLLCVPCDCGEAFAVVLARPFSAECEFALGCDFREWCAQLVG